MGGQAEELPMAQLVRDLQRNSVKYLFVLADERDSWTNLCEFLECDPPVGAYPLMRTKGGGGSTCEEGRGDRGRVKSKRLKFDSAPWIIERSGEWQGVPTVRALLVVEARRKARKY